MTAHTPTAVTRRSLKDVPSQLSFKDQYQELHALGYPDWQIAKRLKMHLASLVTMLHRNDLPISEQLSVLADEERKRRGVHHSVR